MLPHLHLCFVTSFTLVLHHLIYTCASSPLHSCFVTSFTLVLCHLIYTCASSPLHSCFITSFTLCFVTSFTLCFVTSFTLVLGHLIYTLLCHVTFTLVLRHLIYTLLCHLIYTLLCHLIYTCAWSPHLHLCLVTSFTLCFVTSFTLCLVTSFTLVLGQLNPCPLVLGGGGSQEDGGRGQEVHDCAIILKNAASWQNNPFSQGSLQSTQTYETFITKSVGLISLTNLPPLPNDLQQQLGRTISNPPHPTPPKGTPTCSNQCYIQQNPLVKHVPSNQQVRVCSILLLICGPEMVS